MARPTGYNEEFCDVILELFQKGALNCQVYSKLNICKDTFFRWCRQYPEFKDAYDLGRSHAEAFWSGVLQEKALKGDDGGVKACIMILNNNFGWGKDDKGNTTNNILVQGNMTMLSDKSTPELLDLLNTKLNNMSLLPSDIIDVKPNE